MAASHDGKYLAIAGDDHVIRLFDVSLQKTVRELVGHTDWIQSLVFSADAQSLFSGGNDGRVLRWEHRYPVEPTEVLRLPFAIRSLSIASERQLLAVGGFQMISRSGILPPMHGVMNSSASAPINVVFALVLQGTNYYAVVATVVCEFGTWTVASC